jgi:hypothetical protein
VVELGNVPLGPYDPGASYPPFDSTPDPRATVGGISGPVIHDYGVEPPFGPDSPDYGIWLVFSGIFVLGAYYAGYRTGLLVPVGGFAGSLIKKVVGGGVVSTGLGLGGSEPSEHTDGAGQSGIGRDGGSAPSGSENQPGHPTGPNSPGEESPALPQGTAIDVTGTSEALPTGTTFQGDDGNTYSIDQYGNANPVGSGGGGGGFGGGGYSSGGDSSGGDSSGGDSSSGGESSGGESSGGESSGGGSSTPGGGCFIAGTPVLLAGGAIKPIETVGVGDYVISRDETTGNTSAQRVLRMWIHKVKATLLLYLKNGEKVETTKEHRFYSAGQGFVGAGQLSPGATLRTQSEQSVEIIGMEPKEQPATVYNLEIEKFHTYFVGKDGVWVHNLKIGDPDLPDPWDKDP